jgi:hypothetical protein
LIPGTNQIFTALVRDVPHSDLHPALREKVYEFLTNDHGSRVALPPPSAEDLSMGSGPMLRELSQDISTALRDIHKEIERTVFLAYCPPPPVALSADSVEVFVSYTRGDERLRSDLAKHLSSLRNQHLISDWYDHEIRPGQEWEPETMRHLESAQVILLLVSKDYLASVYAYPTEFARALQRHEARTAVVVPIILRPTDWQGAPFSKLQALPPKGNPVTNWRIRDQAFVEIVKGVRSVIESLPSSRPLQPLPASPADRLLDRLTREIEGRHGKVIRGSYTEGETEQSFQDRVSRQLRSSGISLYLDLGAADVVPAGWHASLQSIQLQAAARIFKERSELCLIWPDPNSVSGKKKYPDFPTAKNLAGTFEFLESILCDVVRQRISISQEPCVTGKNKDSLRLFVKCPKVDRPKLSALKSSLDPEHVEIVFDIVEGDPQALRAENAKRVSWSKGVAVFYGSRNELEAQLACNELVETLDELGADLPKAVLLDPDTDEDKKAFFYLDFEKYSSHSFDPLIESMRSS